jgi:hypothetical protein
VFFRLPIGSWEYACGAVKKFSCAAFLSCVLWSALPLASRDDPTTHPPRVTIHFPVGVLSEKVFIAYQLVGPFGGFSQDISPHPDVTSYSFSTSVEGKPAASAKIVAYAPECKFKSFELELSPTSDVDRYYECAPLPTLVVTGHFDPGQIALKNPKVRVFYLADWILSYFGVRDGMVPRIDFGGAEFVCDPVSGIFQINLPDISSDPFVEENSLPETLEIAKGSFELLLQDATNRNSVRHLRVKTDSSPIGELAVKPKYPSVIEFAVEEH